jgi:hypothetical protein
MFSKQVLTNVVQLIVLLAGAIYASLLMFDVDIVHALDRLMHRPFDLIALLVNILGAVVIIFIIVRRLTNTASSLGYSSADSPRDLSINKIEAYDAQDMLSPLLIARSRLTNHIKILRNNAVTNLFIGIGIASLGVIILFWAVLQVGSMQFDELEKVDTYRVAALIIFPKLSITLFIQIFSYFFLAMYRSNQQEIRYFQNEITLIDSLAAALIGANKTPAPQSLKLVLTALSKNERNRLMKKGEKTIVSSDETEFIRALSTLSKLKETLGVSETHT